MMVQMLAGFSPSSNAPPSSTASSTAWSAKPPAANGPAATAPQGYEVGSSGKLTIIDDEKPAVERIFTTYVRDNFGAAAIAKELTADGYRTKAGNPWS